MTSKLRVVCFSPYPEQGPSVRHRIYALAERWSTAGISLTVWPFLSERLFLIRRSFTRSALFEKPFLFAAAMARLFFRLLIINRFDIVIIHREVFPLGPPVIEQLICRIHRPVFYDIDDALWHKPDNGINQRALFWDAQRCAKIMRSCNATVVGSSYLQAYARTYARDVRLIHTTYDDLGGLALKNNTPPVVVWIGNDGNAEYLSLVAPALTRLALEYPLTLRLIGGADISSFRLPNIAIEYHRWNQQTEKELLVSADIGIMPLFDKGYEQGKCSFKIIQYFSAGLPAIATPIGMNSEIITSGQNGFLPQTHNDWVAALQTLIVNQPLRLRMGEAGRKTYLSRFTRATAADGWNQLFADYRSTGK